MLVDLEVFFEIDARPDVRQGSSDLDSERYSVTTTVAYARQVFAINASNQGFPTAFRVGATPVPIPNTEVKPHIGDGTAHVLRGRVARRWDLLERRPTSVGRRSFIQGLVPGGKPVFSYPLSGAQCGPVPEFKDRRNRHV